MVERFIAPVLKTGDPKGSVGSNPTPSANQNFDTRQKSQTGGNRGNGDSLETGVCNGRESFPLFAPFPPVKMSFLCVLCVFVVKFRVLLSDRAGQ